MVSQKPTNSAVKDDSAAILATNQDSNGNGIYGNASAKKVSLEKTGQNRAVSGAVNAINGNDIYGNASETVKVFKTSGILEKKNTEKLEKC